MPRDTDEFKAALPFIRTGLAALIFICKPAPAGMPVEEAIEDAYHATNQFVEQLSREVEGDT